MSCQSTPPSPASLRENLRTIERRYHLRLSVAAGLAVESSISNKLDPCLSGHVSESMAELGKDGSSDDEVYNNVDLISESDEGDPAVEEVEERDIIESEEGRARRVPLTPGSPSSADVAGDAGDEWEGFDIDQHGETGHSDLALTHMNPHFADEMEMFHAASAYDRAASTPVSESKRVRFQIDSDVAHSNSSSSSSDSNRGRFQSLFMQQDQLDPQFRHLIENDQDDEEDSSDESGSEGGQWKDQYHDDLGLGVDLEDDSRSEMSQGSLSGYESESCRRIIAGSACSLQAPW